MTQAQTFTGNFVSENEIVGAGVSLNTEDDFAIDLFSFNKSGEVASHRVSTVVDILELICNVAIAINGGGFDDEEVQLAGMWCHSMYSEDSTLADIFADIQNRAIKRSSFDRQLLAQSIIAALPGTRNGEESAEVPQYALQAVTDFYFCGLDTEEEMQKMAGKAMHSLLVIARKMLK